MQLSSWPLCDCLTVSCLSIWTIRSFPAKLLSCWPDLSIYQCFEVNPSQEQDFALPFVKLADVPVGPFFQSVVVPLNGTMFIWLAAMLPSFVSSVNFYLVMNGDVKIVLDPIWPLGHTAGDQPLDGLFAADNNLPRLTFQSPSLSTTRCPLTWCVLCQLFYEDVLGDTVKSLTEVKDHHGPSSAKTKISFWKANRCIKHDFTFINSGWRLLFTFTHFGSYFQN